MADKEDKRDPERRVEKILPKGKSFLRRLVERRKKFQKGDPTGGTTPVVGGPKPGSEEISDKKEIKTRPKGSGVFTNGEIDRGFKQV